MIRLLIADDHHVIRICLTKLITENSDIKVIGEAETGEAAIQLTNLYTPDVVLMDLKMPGIGGFLAAKTIIANNTNIKILILTGQLTIPEQLMKAGMSGYITKNANVTEIITAIQAVYSGHKYLCTQATFNSLTDQILNAKNPLAVLSKTELLITCMLAKGYKLQDVVIQTGLSLNTIRVYRTRILNKLGVTNNVTLTHLVVKHNLIEKLNTTIL